MMARGLFSAAMLTVLASCNAIIGVDDFGGPSDGDGGPIDAPDGPPATPLLRSPRLGATTGSFRAATALRPELAWFPSVGATRYELALDDSCQITSFRTCVFPSPEAMDASLTGTTFTPSADLAVAMSPPVGRRYYWRVRACNDDGCSAWSEVWYLDVGRLSSDVNGDGFGDIVVGIESRSGGAAQVGVAYIAFGRMTGSVTTTKLTDPSNEIDARFASAVAMVGDVNADGYGDVVVGSWKKNESTRTGVAYLYLGRGTWPAMVTAESSRLVLAIGAPATAFSGTVAGRGDVNGDGYGDIAIGAVPLPFGGGGGTPTTAGFAYIDFGRATWPFSVVGSEIVVPDPVGEATGGFGLGLGLGDLNQDGRADVLAGAAFGNSFLGRGYAFFAPSEIPSTPHTLATPNVAFPTPGTTGMLAFGWTLTTCHGSGAPTLAIGSPFESMPTTNAGVVRLYNAPTSWPSMVTTADRVLPEPAGSFLAHMGIAVRCEDINGDGAADLIAGAPTGDDAGAVYIYDDASSLPTAALSTLTPGGSSGILGSSIAITDFDGDGVNDVFAGAPNLPSSHAGRVLGWLGRAQWPTTSSTPDVSIDNPSGVADESFGSALD